jgi:hypothetical protein
MTNVFELPKSNLQDIPALLEAVSRQIRDGEFGEVTCGAGIFLAGGEVIVCGWGQTDGVHSIGLFNIGANWLCNQLVTR